MVQKGLWICTRREKVDLSAEKTKQIRESGVELLRILAMMGVVLLHYNNATMGQALVLANEGSINQNIVYFVENICICGVCIYVMISGYFMCTSRTRKISKVFELFLQVILFKIIFYIVNISRGLDVFSAKGLFLNALPNNYYVVLYSVLYIISPYINIVLLKLTKKQFEKLVISLVSIFLVWNFAIDYMQNSAGIDSFGLSSVGMTGSQGGYTIVNFIVIYIIGAYIRLHRNERYDNKKVFLLAIIILFAMFGLSLYEHRSGYASVITWNYSNPLLVLLSACWFIIFKNIRLKSRIINELAKGSFTCFLIHGYFISYLKVYEYVNAEVWKLLIHMLISAAGLYLVAYIVYKIYSLCISPIVRLFGKILDRIDISVAVNND